MSEVQAGMKAQQRQNSLGRSCYIDTRASSNSTVTDGAQREGWKEDGRPRTLRLSSGQEATPAFAQRFGECWGSGGKRPAKKAKISKRSRRFAEKSRGRGLGQAKSGPGEPGPYYQVWNCPEAGEPIVQSARAQALRGTQGKHECLCHRIGTCYNRAQLAGGGGSEVIWREWNRLRRSGRGYR